jgi:hypothetical protein
VDAPTSDLRPRALEVPANSGPLAGIGRPARQLPHDHGLREDDRAPDDFAFPAPVRALEGKQMLPG